MSNEPLNTDAIIQRIKELVPALQVVGTAADYAAAQAVGSFRTPSAYVVLTSERSNNDIPRKVYQVRAVFGVAIAVRNYGDTTGAKAKDDLRPIAGAIRTALVGWRPGDRAAGSSACAWLQGEVLDYNQSTLLWGDEFETTYFINGV